jgi:hypothetical protein
LSDCSRWLPSVMVLRVVSIDHDAHVPVSGFFPLSSSNSPMPKAKQERDCVEDETVKSLMPVLAPNCSSYCTEHVYSIFSINESCTRLVLDSFLVKPEAQDGATGGLSMCCPLSSQQSGKHCIHVYNTFFSFFHNTICLLAYLYVRVSAWSVSHHISPSGENNVSQLQRAL